jgi:hypothetical protein
MQALNISQMPQWKQDQIVIDGLTRKVEQLQLQLERQASVSNHIFATSNINSTLHHSPFTIHHSPFNFNPTSNIQHQLQLQPNIQNLTYYGSSIRPVFSHQFRRGEAFAKRTKISISRAITMLRLPTPPAHSNTRLLSDNILL